MDIPIFNPFLFLAEKVINAFHAFGIFLYPLKTLEKLPVFYLSTPPENIRKTPCFLSFQSFSGAVKRYQWYEMGKLYLFRLVSNLIQFQVTELITITYFILFIIKNSSNRSCLQAESWARSYSSNLLIFFSSVT